MRTWAIILFLCLASACVAQECGEQAFARLDEVDANQVRVDPSSGNHLLLGYLWVKTHMDLKIRFTACDNNTDTMLVWRDNTDSPGDPNTGVILTSDPNTNEYSFTVQYANSGLHYESLGVTDGTAVRMGTVAIMAYENQAPVLTILPAEVVANNPLKLKQKLLMVWYKYTGRPLTSGYVLASP